MPHRYRVAFPNPNPPPSDPRDPFFDSWAEFKERRSHNNGSPMICGVFDEAKPSSLYNPAKVWPTLVVGSECLRLQSLKVERIFLELGEALMDEIEAEMRAVPTQAPDFVADDVVKFVKQLIRDRLGHDQGQTRSSDGPEELPEDDATEQGAEETSSKYSSWQVQLMIATAAVTKCYFDAKVRSLHSVSRWAIERLRLSDDDDSGSAVETLNNLINTLEPHREPGTRRVLEVARDAREGLLARTISLASLQALTEITWNVITGPFPLYSWYPEWSEFLVRLSLDEKRSRLLRQGPPRPAVVSTDDAAKMVAKALIETTRESARLYGRTADEVPRSTHGLSAEDEILRLDTYKQFAEMLFAMAKFRAPLLIKTQSRVRPTPRGPVAPMAETMSSADAPARVATQLAPPPASAFVTTFDLELELALAHTHPEEPFIVAIPVNLIDNLEGGDERLATTMWLGCVVRPPVDDPLAHIIQPPIDSWFVFGERRSGRLLGVDDALVGDGLGLELMREALPEGVRLLGELPIIVRLAGSPLVELPEVQDAEGQIVGLGRIAAERAGISARITEGETGEPEWVRGGLVQLQFTHATLLDEHNAIRLSLPEVVSEHGLGLPQDLTLGSTTSSGYWRYWMLFGVEMSDPAIRYRVISQILGAGLLNNSGDFQRPERLGFALNRKVLNARALDLLLWCGFDIVQDSDALALVRAEVAHYLQHLRDGQPGNWPGRTRACGLSAVSSPGVDQ